MVGRLFENSSAATDNNFHSINLFVIFSTNNLVVSSSLNVLF